MQLNYLQPGTTHKRLKRDIGRTHIWYMSSRTPSPLACWTRRWSSVTVFAWHEIPRKFLDFLNFSVSIHTSEGREGREGSTNGVITLRAQEKHKRDRKKTRKPPRPRIPHTPSVSVSEDTGGSPDTIKSKIAHQQLHLKRHGRVPPRYLPWRFA